MQEGLLYSMLCVIFLTRAHTHMHVHTHTRLNDLYQWSSFFKAAFIHSYYWHEYIRTIVFKIYSGSQFYIQFHISKIYTFKARDVSYNLKLCAPSLKGVATHPKRQLCHSTEETTGRLPLINGCHIPLMVGVSLSAIYGMSHLIH